MGRRYLNRRYYYARLDNACPDAENCAHTTDGRVAESESEPATDSRDGYQCAGCGDYFPRGAVKDMRGEYYCRDGMGHNRAKRS